MRASCRRWRAARRSAPSRSPIGRRAPTPARSTRAERVDDGWRITGAKQWITNGGFRRHDPHSSRAPTRRARAPAASRPSSSTATDVEVTHEAEKLGLNSSQTVDLALDGVEVDCDRLLHEEGRGFRIAMATLDGGRIGIAAQAVGIAQAGFDVAREYAKERHGLRTQDRANSRRSSEARDMSTRDRRRTAAHLPGRLAEGSGRAAHRGRGEGEALRLRDGTSPDRRGDPDPRRLRLHEGVSGRALLPRREDHRDLRGHERDPAARDRARAPRG